MPSSPSSSSRCCNRCLSGKPYKLDHHDILANWPGKGPIDACGELEKLRQNRRGVALGTGQMTKFLLPCMSPLLAQSRHSTTEFQCPLLGVKRTLARLPPMSAFDPKRTFGPEDCCHAK